MGIDDKPPYYSKRIRIENKLILENDVSNRFWSKVSRNPNGCWEWLGYKNRDGYGKVGIHRKILSVHRVSYNIFKGKIPKGLEIDHLCKNRSCVNPEHLEAITHKENVRRGLAGKINGMRQRSKTHCPQGHEYSKENTRIYNKDWRMCIICRKIQHNMSYHKRKLEVLCNV